MKAVRLRAYDGPLALEDVPAPTIADDEILVKTRGTAVNHLDLVEHQVQARRSAPKDGEEGLRDRRLGRPSPKKVPAVARSRMLYVFGL
jgi:hypothetical protein